MAWAIANYATDGIGHTYVKPGAKTESPEALKPEAFKACFGLRVWGP